MVIWKKKTLINYLIHRFFYSLSSNNTSLLIIYLSLLTKKLESHGQSLFLSLIKIKYHIIERNQEKKTKESRISFVVLFWITYSGYTYSTFLIILIELVWIKERVSVQKQTRHWSTTLGEIFFDNVINSYLDVLQTDIYEHDVIPNPNHQDGITKRKSDSIKSHSTNSFQHDLVKVVTLFPCMSQFFTGHIETDYVSK